MSLPELALGLVFLLLVANAARRGFLREGSLLLGLGLALWLDGRLYRQLGGAVRRGEGDDPWLVVVYVGLALVLLVAAAGLSSLIAPLVRRGPLRLLDRMAGLAVGLVEATLVVGLLAMVGERSGALHLSPGGPTAWTVGGAGLGLAWLASTIPPEILTLAHPR